MLSLNKFNEMFYLNYIFGKLQSGVEQKIR